MQLNERLENFTSLSKYKLDDLFIFMKHLESLHATCAIAYHTRVVKERVPDIDDVEKKVRKSKEVKEALREQKIANLPKAEQKMLKDREKAVQALVSVGIPREIAEKEVDATMKGQGKLVKVD